MNKLQWTILFLRHLRKQSILHQIYHRQILVYWKVQGFQDWCTRHGVVSGGGADGGASAGWSELSSVLLVHCTSSTAGPGSCPLLPHTWSRHSWVTWWIVRQFNQTPEQSEPHDWLWYYQRPNLHAVELWAVILYFCSSFVSVITSHGLFLCEYNLEPWDFDKTERNL